MKMKLSGGKKETLNSDVMFQKTNRTVQNVSVYGGGRHSGIQRDALGKWAEQ